MNTSNARPRPNDPAILAIAAEALAKECADWSHDGTSVEQWKETLLSITWSHCGYKMARRLEEDHLVEPDAELVEILEGAYSRHASVPLHKAVQDWVTKFDIRPSYTVGQRITSRHITGEISAINFEQAFYLVIPDHEREKFKNGGGYHVNFEDAAPELTPTTEAA